MAYVEEFLYRGRDQANEAGKAPAWHVVLAEWVNGLDGVPRQQRVGPMGQAAAEALGFTLEAILGEVAAGAIKNAEIVGADASAMLNQASERETALKDSVDRASELAQEAIAQRGAALARVAELEALLGQSLKQTASAIGQREAMAAKLDEATNAAEQLTKERDAMAADAKPAADMPGAGAEKVTKE